MDPFLSARFVFGEFKFQFSTFSGISFVSASKDPSSKSSQTSHHVLLTPTEVGASLQQLLQQREEENRLEIERLTAEIKALKLQLLQYTNGKSLQCTLTFTIHS